MSPAPLVLAAAPAAQAVGKALTGDIVRFSGKLYRRTTRKEPVVNKQGQVLLTKKGRVRERTVQVLEPLDVDIHVNAVSLLAGAGAALLGAIAFYGVGPFKGIQAERSGEAPVGENLLDLLSGLFPISGPLLRRR